MMDAGDPGGNQRITIGDAQTLSTRDNLVHDNGDSLERAVAGNGADALQ